MAIRKLGSGNGSFEVVSKRGKKLGIFGSFEKAVKVLKSYERDFNRSNRNDFKNKRQKDLNGSVDGT